MVNAKAEVPTERLTEEQSCWNCQHSYVFWITEGIYCNLLRKHVKPWTALECGDHTFRPVRK